MEMPENYRIDGDKLIITVNEVDYEFAEKKDFIRSDSEKLLMKHHAIVTLAQNANITVSMPVLMSSHDISSYVIAREAKRADGVRLSAVGEANRDNLFSEYLQQYPAETADNRAYDRAVLGVVGVYGRIYSTSEFSFNDRENKPKPKKDTPAENTAEKPDEVKVDAEDAQTETAESTDGELPIWWNDVGVGVYSDAQLAPETFIITEGQCKDRSWTVKNLYDCRYDSCWYFATRTLDNAKSENFIKQVYSCRRAIKKYGIQKKKEEAQ